MYIINDFAVEMTYTYIARYTLVFKPAAVFILTECKLFFTTLINTVPPLVSRAWLP